MCRGKEGPTEAQQHIGIGVGRACFFVGVFFTLMVLLNGVSMYTSATRLEYGPAHDFWVAVLRPVERVSRVSGLFRLRDLAEKTVGERLNKTSDKNKVSE